MYTPLFSKEDAVKYEVNYLIIKWELCSQILKVKFDDSKKTMNLQFLILKLIFKMMFS